MLSEILNAPWVKSRLMTVPFSGLYACIYLTFMNVVRCLQTKLQIDTNILQLSSSTRQFASIIQLVKVSLSWATLAILSDCAFSFGKVCKVPVYISTTAITQSEGESGHVTAAQGFKQGVAFSSNCKLALV